MFMIADPGTHSSEVYDAISTDWPESLYVLPPKGTILDERRPSERQIDEVQHVVWIKTSVLDVLPGMNEAFDALQSRGHVLASGKTVVERDVDDL